MIFSIYLIQVILMIFLLPILNTQEIDYFGQHVKYPLY